MPSILPELLILLSCGMDRIPFQATRAGAQYQSLAALPVSILLDNVRSLYNVGAFFRTADAAAIEKLYLCGITGRPPKRAISKTALSADETDALRNSAKTDAAAFERLKRLAEGGTRMERRLAQRRQRIVARQQAERTCQPRIDLGLGQGAFQRRQ